MHAYRGNRRLKKCSNTWDHEVKKGDHLQMSMVLQKRHDQIATGEFCPFLSCYSSLDNIEMTNVEKLCARCNRWSLVFGVSCEDSLKFGGLCFEDSLGSLFNQSDDQSDADHAEELYSSNDGDSVVFNQSDDKFDADHAEELHSSEMAAMRDSTKD
jgi:hypothetical protein